jgi:rubrerythrin
MREQMSVKVPVEVDLKVMVNGQEVKDENKSRDEERGNESGASKEAGKVPNEGKEKEGTEDEKVTVKDSKIFIGKEEIDPELVLQYRRASYQKELDEKMFAGDLEGSWEWIEHKLRSKAKKFLIVSDVSVGENDWVSVIGTYSDHAIICMERMGEFEYYRASWSNMNGEPSFTGELKKVHIETTTQITEKMRALKKADSESGKEDEKGDLICPKCDYKGQGKDGKCPECGAKLVLKAPDKSFVVEKVGRVLSKANEGKIKEAIDDLAEVAGMEIPRPAKALLNQAKRGLSEVVASLGMDDGAAKETSGKMGVKKAMAIVLTEGSESDLDTLRSLLEVFEKREEAESMVEQFSEFVSQ